MRQTKKIFRNLCHLNSCQPRQYFYNLKICDNHTQSPRPAPNICCFNRPLSVVPVQVDLLLYAAGLPGQRNICFNRKTLQLQTLLFSKVVQHFEEHWKSLTFIVFRSTHVLVLTPFSPLISKHHNQPRDADVVQACKQLQAICLFETHKLHKTMFNKFRKMRDLFIYWVLNS